MYLGIDIGGTFIKYAIVDDNNEIVKAWKVPTIKFETKDEFYDYICLKIEKEYDFDALMGEFRELAGQLMQKSQTNGIKITQIVDKYLGKGKKVGDATPDQAEFIHLIVTEIKEDLM